MIKVLVVGARGRMGTVSIAAIKAHPKLSFAAECNRGDDLTRLIQTTQPDVVLDFTTLNSVIANANIVIDHKIRLVIGTTGLLPQQIEQLQMRCAEKKLGAIIAPNFCIGAVLMMRFAEQAAKYYSHAEIIEYHHDQKQEAPSGTAIKTADILAKVRPNIRGKSAEIITGARGANLNEVPVHAVRLPGLLAHQEILFGSTGELLTIRHDSFNREAYQPGICFACEKVMELDHLVYGLEDLI